MKNKTLKDIEKEYQNEQGKLLMLVTNPKVNIEEVNKQKSIVDNLWKEYLKMCSKITRMKGGKW